MCIRDRPTADPIQTTESDVHTTLSTSGRSPIPTPEVPVGKGFDFEVTVAVVAGAMVILFLLVVVAMVTLVVVCRRAQRGKRVVMLGNNSPIENPSYVIGGYVNT